VPALAGEDELQAAQFDETQVHQQLLEPGVDDVAAAYRVEQLTEFRVTGWGWTSLDLLVEHRSDFPDFLCQRILNLNQSQLITICYRKILIDI